MGPEAGAFRFVGLHCRVERCSSWSVCAHNFLRILQVVHIFQLFLPDPFILRFPPLLSFLYHYPGGRRRRRARLILDHSAAGASRTTRRGQPCEGGRPGGWPGLSRTPPISEEPLRGMGGLGNTLLAMLGSERRC